MTSRIVGFPACRLHLAELMRRTLLLVVTLLLSLPSLADSGMWGQRGFSRAFVTRGDVLYAADGRGVAVYDVSAANEVRRIDVEWSDDETYDLALLGTTDLVVATSHGVERFAIAGNGALDRLGSTTAPGPTAHLAASDRYAAAASGSMVTILERTPSGGLSVVRRLAYKGAVTALAFVGDHLYVTAEREPLRVYLPPESAAVHVLAGVGAEQFARSGTMLWAVAKDDGLTGLDVSSPAGPVVVSVAGRGELRLTGVAAAGTSVFAVEGPDRLHVFDVSTPGEPVRIGTLNDWVSAVAASGARLFLAGDVIDGPALAFDPDAIPRGTGKPVRMFDVTHPAQPVLAAEFTDRAGPVSGVWTDGSVAYVVDPPYFRVLDVSKSASPREVASLIVPDLQDRIRVKNGLAVLYGRALVNLIDVSTPLRPQLLGTWDAQGHPPSAAAILQTRVVEANNHSGLHIVDFSNPTQPVQIGGRKWHYLDLAASDDAVYALQFDSLLVVQVAGERTVIDQADLPGAGTQVDTAPPNASRPDSLLLRGPGGLRLFSLEDRFHPQETGVLSMPDLGLFATGHASAWVVRDGRLHFVDLTRELALVPSEMRVTSPLQMSVAGDKIVVADRYSVRIYGPDTAAPPPPPLRRRSTRH